MTMPRTSLGSAGRSRLHGFFLVELLVVLASISVLIALLLPPVQAVREAAAKAQVKNSIAATLCDPPLCDSLFVHATLHFPTIPASLSVLEALTSGVTLAYNANGLPNGDVFSIVPFVEPADNLYTTSFPFAANLFPGDDYGLVGGHYINGKVLLEVSKSGQTAPFTLAASFSGNDGVIALASPVPEPASVYSIMAALSVLITFRRLTRRPETRA